MNIVFSAIASGAMIAVYFFLSKGKTLEASYMFTLAVWAWGKSDYYRLKEKMKDGDGDG